VQRGFLLNVVVTQSSSIFQLLSGEDQPLLFRRNAFLVLNLCLDIRDRVIWFNVQSDRLSGQRFHKNLHGTTSKAKHQVQRGFLLNVVVTQSSSIFQLLSGENQPLLLRWDSFLVLDLCFHVRDRVVWFDVKGDRLTSQRFHEDLHGTTTEAED